MRDRRWRQLLTQSVFAGSCAAAAAVGAHAVRTPTGVHRVAEISFRKIKKNLIAYGDIMRHRQ